MRPELIVAEKEFRDHITSKRFIVIFGIMMLLAIYAVTTGTDAYNKALDQYKNPENSPYYYNQQQYMNELQQRIQESQARNDSADMIQSMQNQLDVMRNPPMPSVLNVFQSMTFLFTFVGMVLGAAMGFDQIAREKDEGSIKFLASSPIYRDAIVNGKTIGAIMALSAAMGAAFAIAIAIVMLKGIVPGLEDLVRIFLFFLAGMLYCTVFFALAMMVSAFSKNTAIAAIFTVGMVFAVFIFTIMALLAANMIASSIVGPAPVIEYPYYPQVITMNESSGNVTVPTPPYDFSTTSDYYNRLQQTQSQISSVLSAFSPIDSFSGYPTYYHMGIGPALITRQSTNTYTYGSSIGMAGAGKEMSLLDALAIVWMRVLILIAEIIAAFGIAYVAFMRTDIR
jgi:ABC-2 type transport system permease protein